MSQMSFGQTFDTTNAPERTSADALPAGNYPATPVALEVVHSKDGNATAVKCQFQVLDGEHRNRMIFDNFMTIAHKTSTKAHDIGQRRLRDWCYAVGAPLAVDSLEPFVGRAVVVKVQYEKGTPYVGQDNVQKMGGAKNRIDGFARYEAAAPVLNLQRPTASATPPAAPAAAPAPAVAVPAPAAPRTAPWQRPR